MVIRHPTKLFYLCPIENLASILKRGIFSHNLVEQKRLRTADLSDPTVQQRRANNAAFKLFSGGKSLHEYVNLYINPNGPMMANILFKQRKIEQTVILIVDGTRVFSREGAIVADGNCASANTGFQWASTLTTEEWARISRLSKSETSIDTVENRRRQAAEVLVPESLEPDYINAVSCGTPSVRKRVDELRKRSGVGTPQCVSQSPISPLRGAICSFHV